MTEYTSIRVKQDAKDAAEKRKPDSMTWSEYIASETYEPELSVAVDYAEVASRTADEVEKRLR